ncbi:hypothetical protein [Luteibacter sp.]|uniref:hypothetical protein n=1 Tax=Luteibacter sp. TaxID=1886636 RepID=UPI003F80587C
MTLPRWILSASLLICAAFAYAGSADAAQSEHPAVAPSPGPGPDLQGLWIRLLESIPPGDPMREGERSPWYLSIAESEGEISDPPPAVTARVRIPGIQVLPAALSPYSSAAGPGELAPPLIFIHYPTELIDGRYEVIYEDYLGRNGGTHVVRAFMIHDVAGWRVFSRGPYPGSGDRSVPIIM